MGAHLLSAADSAKSHTWGARCLLLPRWRLVSVTFHMTPTLKTSCSQKAKISFSLKAWKGKEKIKNYVGHNNPLKMKWLILNAENELSLPISRQKKENRSL